MHIPLARPVLGPEEEEAAAGVIRSGWLVAGEQVRRFEEAVAGYLGAPFAVACANGTCALEIAMQLSGIGPGDEVIVPSFTWIACPNAVRAVGAEPVLCDVDADSFNATAETIEPHITGRTRAIMVVHQFGLPADIDSIQTLASDRGLAVIEDAACALGSRDRGRLVGTRGQRTCFSFHPRKVITTGEGGMIVLSDEAEAVRARQLIDHRSSDAALVAHNYRLTDMQGAIGVVQMSRLEELLVQRQELAARYHAAFAAIDGVIPPSAPDHVEPNWQSYVVRIEDRGAANRDRVARALEVADIASRPGTLACHRQRPYRQDDTSAPVSARLADTSLSLPLYPRMEHDVQDRVIDAVVSAVRA